MTDQLNELLGYRKNHELSKYREGLKYLTCEEDVLLDLYLRKVALGDLDKDFTGYPSLDKPWLKYYSEDDIKADVAYMTAIEYLKKANENNLNLVAINSMEEKGILTYKELFEMIDKTAKSLDKMGVHKGEIITGIFPSTMAYEVYLLYAVDIIGAVVNFMDVGTPIEEICNQFSEFSAEYFFTFADYLSNELEEYIYENTNIKNMIVVGFG